MCFCVLLELSHNLFSVSNQVSPQLLLEVFVANWKLVSDQGQHLQIWGQTILPEKGGMSPTHCLAESELLPHTRNLRSSGSCGSWLGLIDYRLYFWLALSNQLLGCSPTCVHATRMHVFKYMLIISTALSTFSLWLWRAQLWIFCIGVIKILAMSVHQVN